jgi:hypothetical protein
VINPKLDAQPREPAPVLSSAAPLAGRRAVRWALHQPVFWGLLTAFTVYYATFSGLSFHLYSLLLEQGFNTATMVAVIAIIGPSQVVGRIAVWGIADTTLFWLLSWPARHWSWPAFGLPRRRPTRRNDQTRFRDKPISIVLVDRPG